jgi:hypothetical protein
MNLSPLHFVLSQSGFIFPKSENPDMGHPARRPPIAFCLSNRDL